MKTILCLIAILISFNSFAEVVEIENSKVGTLRVEITDVGEPAMEPLRMKVQIKCQGEEKWRGVNFTETKQAVESICDYRAHRCDEREGSKCSKNPRVVSLRFSKVGPTEGKAECDDHILQEFDLTKLCQRR